MSSDIPQPSTKIDWSSLGFKLQETNGHVEYHYKDGAWDSGTWVADPFMKIHVGCVALNYGQSVCHIPLLFMLRREFIEATDVRRLESIQM